LPEYQNKGIAQKVFEIIEEKYKPENGWCLDAILQETGNCYLYEKMGYNRTGKIEKINDRMGIVYYEKKYTCKYRWSTRRTSEGVKYITSAIYVTNVVYVASVIYVIYSGANGCLAGSKKNKNIFKNRLTGFCASDKIAL
jgi:hypothetical protein